MKAVVKYNNNSARAKTCFVGEGEKNSSSWSYGTEREGEKLPALFEEGETSKFLFVM